jgi:ABC-2 type transport system ATP-binding protein
MSNGSDMVVQIDTLIHAYKKQVALRGVTFGVQRQTIHGFVGPNGAGKTTTLKILATLLKPQGGLVRVFSHDIRREYKEIRKKIGFMPDHFSMYRQMTVFEYLDFFAAAYGMGQAERDRTIGDVLALTDMDGRKNDFIRSLSRGMQQRVSLARVLVHDPELLLLDEPASGLDPRARIELMEILQELRGMGKTIFISSHILSELATLCDEVTILDRGEVKYNGTMAGLLVRDGDTLDYVLTLSADHEPCEQMLRGMTGVTEVAKTDGTGRYRVTFHKMQTDQNRILQAVMQTGAQVTGFQQEARHLNQAFMALTDPGVPPSMTSEAPPPRPPPTAVSSIPPPPLP